MPIETDLKRAYALLYEEKNPEEALKLYDSVLKQSSENLIALIYKAAALEKLYYGYQSWHNEETLNTANDLLSKALVVAESRGDRSKIALVHFRFFVHHFNNGEYLVAEKYLHKSKAFGYNENTLQMWETSLSNKLKNVKARHEDQGYKEIWGADSNVNKQTTSTEDKHMEKRGDGSKPKPNISFRTEWYQSTQNVSISIFAQRIPKSADIVKVEITDGVKLKVTYPLPDLGEKFVYSLILAHPVESNYKLTLLTKKIEVNLCKKQRIQWKSLEAQESAAPPPLPIPQHPKQTDSASALRYPTSSKKEIDWDKLDIGDGEEENDSADAFFQSLYANADPDTKRAMMKSFIESNGTALNTNWEEVSKGKVETSVPEGVDLKEL